MGVSERACVCYADCLRVCREYGDKTITGYALSGMALLAVHQADWQRAVLLLAAAAALREGLETALTAEDSAEQERTLTSLRVQLEPDLFQTLYAQGHSLGLEATVAYALGEPLQTEAAYAA